MEEFVVGLRKNNNFNYLVAIYFTAEGGGAALLLAALFTKCSDAIAAGIVMIILGAASLLLDLGQPKRFWRSVIKPGSSWISRGSIFVGALIFLSLIYTIFPGLNNSSIGEIIRLLAALLCLLTGAYTGYLINSFSAVPAWSNHYIPQLFILHSAATGLIIARFVFNLAGVGALAGSLSLLEILILGPTLLMTCNYYRITARGGPAEQESARILTQGEMKSFFQYGALLTGLIVPLVLALAAYFGSANGFWNSSWLLLIAALARIAGDYSFRFAIIKSGVYEPVFS